MNESSAVLRLTPRPAGPQDVNCPTCNKLIFDSTERVLLSRVTRLPANGPAEACCKMCKTWVKVPVRADLPV